MNWFPIEFDLKRGDRVKLLTSDGEVYQRGSGKETLIYLGTILGEREDDHYPIRWDWSDDDKGQTPAVGTVPVNYDPFWNVKCCCGKKSEDGDYLCRDCRNNPKS